MAILNTQGLSGSQVKNRLIDLLKQHREVLNELAGYHSWAAGFAAADLVTAWPNDFDTATAQGLLNAVGDAYAEFVNRNTGISSVTASTSPAIGYKYGDSQNAFIGPA